MKSQVKEKRKSVFYWDFSFISFYFGIYHFCGMGLTYFSWQGGMVNICKGKDDLKDPLENYVI